MASINWTNAGSSMQSVDIASTAGYVYICKNFTKKIEELTQADFEKICRFANGTFQWIGEEGTTTSRTYEDGDQYAAIFTKGTEGFSGEIPNMSIATMDYFFGESTKVSVAASGEAGTAIAFGGYDLHAYGKEVPSFDKAFVLVEILQGSAFDFIAYPNATVSAQKTGEGNTEGELRTLLSVNASSYGGVTGENPAFVGQTMIVGKKS